MENDPVNHWNWKGGKSNRPDGYVLVRKPGHPNANMCGYVLEHRFIMSESIGRPLKKGESVHHINEIKSDNRIENLKLCASNKEHSKFHRGKCKICGEDQRAGNLCEKHWWSNYRKKGRKVESCSECGFKSSFNINCEYFICVKCKSKKLHPNRICIACGIYADESKHLCALHYQRWRTRGRPLDDSGIPDKNKILFDLPIGYGSHKVKPKKFVPCFICGQKAIARKLCNNHYLAWKYRQWPIDENGIPDKQKILEPIPRGYWSQKRNKQTHEHPLMSGANGGSIFFSDFNVKDLTSHWPDISILT